MKSVSHPWAGEEFAGEGVGDRTYDDRRQCVSMVCYYLFAALAVSGPTTTYIEVVLFYLC